MVSIYSAASCLGRLATAFVPEKAFRDLGFGRTNFLTISTLVAAAASFLNAHYTLSLLPLCSFMTGFVFGFMQGLAPTIVSEVFGLANFASNYAMLNTGLIAGSFAMANLLMSAVYDDNTAAGELRCTGRKCFRAGFVVCGALCLLAALCSLALAMRTQQLYRRLRRAILRERRKRGLTGYNRQKELRARIMEQQLARASLLLVEAEQRVHELGEELRSQCGGDAGGSELDAKDARLGTRRRDQSTSLGAWIPLLPDTDASDAEPGSRAILRKLLHLRAALSQAAMALDPDAAANQNADDDTESLASTQM